MVHISLLPPTLSSRVTSVWSPRLAARPLPSSVYSLPSSYTSANGWKWETSCLRIGAGFLELKLLTHDRSFVSSSHSVSFHRTQVIFLAQCVESTQPTSIPYTLESLSWVVQMVGHTWTTPSPLRFGAHLSPTTIPEINVALTETVAPGLTPMVDPSSPPPPSLLYELWLALTATEN